MKRLLANVAVAVCAIAAAAERPAAGLEQRGLPPRGSLPPSAPSQQVPQFRSRVDLVHLDVSVLDRNRRPVKGLGPADFTVLENGVEQSIAAFSAVDMPDPEPPKAAWMRDVAPDVRTNEDLKERRLFLIIIDDAATELYPVVIKNIRESALRVVDRLHPADLAAVVFTRNNKNSQDFTADRARLRAAIETYKGGSREGMPELYFRMSVEVVMRAVQSLVDLPDRRKAVVYLGEGVPVDLTMAGPAAMGLASDGGFSAISQRGAMEQLIHMMSLAFESAARANINVYTIDACGFRVAAPNGKCLPGLEVDYLINLAAATRGHAGVNSNDLAPAVDAIFVENASYYLLGYQATDLRQDGKQRRIEVRVNRPGVEVRARNGYVAEKPDAAAKRKADLASRPLGAALAGILPKGDLPLQLTAVPFAVPGKKEAGVAVILGVRQPIRDTGARTIEKVDLVVRAFDTNGKAFGATNLRADVTIRADASGLAEYEVLSRIDLKPGRYQLRTAANVGSLGTAGSLYYDVVVPDFMDQPVSLSALVLSSTAAPIVAPRDGLKTLIPVVPTTKRTFRPADQASAFLRIYQGDNKPITAVPLRIQLRNDSDILVFDRREEVAAGTFSSARAADLNVALPLSRLTPGAYLLTIEATLKNTVRRDLRFNVQ
jgi:VWFA-related protein